MEFNAEEMVLSALESHIMSYLQENNELINNIIEKQMNDYIRSYILENTEKIDELIKKSLNSNLENYLNHYISKTDNPQDLIVNSFKDGINTHFKDNCIEISSCYHDAIYSYFADNNNLLMNTIQKSIKDSFNEYLISHEKEIGNIDMDIKINENRNINKTLKVDSKPEAFKTNNTVKNTKSVNNDVGKNIDSIKAPESHELKEYGEEYQDKYLKDIRNIENIENIQKAQEIPKSTELKTDLKYVVKPELKLENLKGMKSNSKNYIRVEDIPKNGDFRSILSEEHLKKPELKEIDKEKINNVDDEESEKIKRIDEKLAKLRLNRQEKQQNSNKNDKNNSNNENIENIENNVLNNSSNLKIKGLDKLSKIDENLDKFSQDIHKINELYQKDGLSSKNSNLKLETETSKDIIKSHVAEINEIEHLNAQNTGKNQDEIYKDLKSSLKSSIGSNSYKKLDENLKDINKDEKLKLKVTSKGHINYKSPWD
ncbi:hypothetical protein M2325_000944 [Methanococcus voltae PS]|uniref:Uncharacterized protein n=1 Tax=Methanococcus voltae PS TaxID=523842 RepID=A0ABT2EWC6_METVO|nr:hypothetical protein [Methanococcus voltae]MCS3922259.1 hypothetical protein [Methanococcus voltae PS]